MYVAVEITDGAYVRTPGTNVKRTLHFTMADMFSTYQYSPARYVDPQIYHDEIAEHFGPDGDGVIVWKPGGTTVMFVQV